MGNGDIPVDKTKKKRVGVAGQIILCIFIPLVFYALGRIEKLRLGALMYVSLLVVFWIPFFTDILENVTPPTELGTITAFSVFYAPTIIIIFLVVKWTKEWNSKIGEVNP